MVRIIQLRPVLENTHLRWSEQTHQKQQANVEYRKAVLQQENTRKQLETQYTNSVSDLMNNQRNYENNKATTSWPKKFTWLQPINTKKE